MLAFSTCWNSSKHSDGETIIDEIVEIGFEWIEISHGLNVSRLPGIQEAFRKGKFKVSGVHNFCPSPMEVLMDQPDIYQYTSHRTFDRSRAMKHTLKTLELAETFAARYVVLHLGSVPMKPLSKQLTQMVKDGKLNDRDFVKLKLKTIRTREKTAPRYYARAREALQEIAAKAKEVGVPVAVESRSRYEDLPSEREMVRLMEEFADDPWVGYWHDFGHVQLKHNLSLLDHRQWLESMQPYLIGCHLHDVVWPARDHRVPFAGSIDYDQLMHLVPAERPIVWELSPSRKKSDIKKALPLWIERYGR